MYFAGEEVRNKMKNENAAVKNYHAMLPLYLLAH